MTTELDKIKKARTILGTASKDMSDEQLARLLALVDVLTDIVVNHASDSKI